MITIAENSRLNGPPRDVQFLLLPLESIQSLTHGLYAAHREHTHETSSRFRLHTYGIDNATITVHY